MKKQSFKNKLVLNKSTITNLSDQKMINLNGGGTILFHCFTEFLCTQVTCTIGWTKCEWCPPKV